MHRLYELETKGSEAVLLICICVGLTLLAGLVSGLTLGLMSLGEHHPPSDSWHALVLCLTCMHACSGLHCAVLTRARVQT